MKVTTCATTSGLFIMKVCVTGRVIWSAMPSSFVLSTETLPSFGPVKNGDRIGLSERLPAMMPSS